MQGKWYTGTGDDGYTALLGRGRVPKYDERPDAYGTVDEASAALGLARAQARDTRVRDLLLAVQRELYAVMADLATAPETATGPGRGGRWRTRATTWGRGRGRQGIA